MSDETLEFTFDLSRITIDEALDILEYDPSNVSPKYIAGFAKSIKKTLVRGSRELTGADLPAVIQAFSASIMGGDSASKNLS